MFSFLAEHADGRTLPFLQYVATMAAVDAIQECADEALAEAAAAYRRAGAILEIAYGRHHPATTEARDSELAARARMQSLH